MFQINPNIKCPYCNYEFELDFRYRYCPDCSRAYATRIGFKFADDKLVTISGAEYIVSWDHDSVSYEDRYVVDISTYSNSIKQYLSTC